MIRLIKDFDTMDVAVRFLDDGVSTEGTMADGGHHTCRCRPGRAVENPGTGH